MAIAARETAVGLVRLTNDNVPDDNPQLGIDPNGHFILAWLKSDDLVTAIDFDLNNAKTVTINEYSTSFADFRMATGSDGRFALLPFGSANTGFAAHFVRPNSSHFATPDNVMPISNRNP